MVNYETIAKKYRDLFGEIPPIITTLDVENEEYLKVIEKSIKDKKPLTRDMLGEIFMKDNEAVH